MHVTYVTSTPRVRHVYVTCTCRAHGERVPLPKFDISTGQDSGMVLGAKCARSKRSPSQHIHNTHMESHMAKSNKSTTPAVNLTGLTAKQMREMLDAKQIAPATVIAFLKAKETERGSLRYPARTLLAELTGDAKPAAASPAAEKPAAKPAAAKPAASPTPAVAPALDLADIAGRLDRLEASVAALVNLLAAKAEAKPEPVAAAPVVAPKPVAAKPEPVAVAPATAKPEPVAAATGSGFAAKATNKPAPAASPLPSEGEMRTALAGVSVRELRAEAVASKIAGAESMNKAGLIDALVSLVLAEQQMLASPKPVKPALRVVRETEVSF